MASSWRRVRPSLPPRHDLLLLGATAVLIIVGLAVMASIGEARDAMDREPRGIFSRHLQRVAVGLVACMVGAATRPETWRHLAKPLLLITLLLLVLPILPRVGLIVDGVHASKNGAYRSIWIGSISVMPGELFKIVLVLWLAHFLSLKGTHPDLTRSLAYPMFVVGIAVVLFALQPSLGAAAGVTVLALVMLFLAGVSAPRLGTVLCVGAVLAGTLLIVPKAWSTHAPGAELIEEGTPQRHLWGHLADRLKQYVPPWQWEPRRLCYHSQQSLIALGFGGLGGQGLGKGRHSYGRLPESHTDYPLAAIGEELGFVGTSLVALAWTVILIRGMTIALGSLHQYSFLLAAGITMNLIIFATANAAVVTALVPVTGQAMPFVSYGGAGTVLNLFSLGVLDAIHRSNQ